MSRDAKWYANWIRLLPASTPDEKMRNLEAADMLAQIEAAQPKWISVEERLPEEFVGVLTYEINKISNEVTRIGISYMHDGAWWRSEEKISWKVTHWMPLPSIPQPQKE